MSTNNSTTTSTLNYRTRILGSSYTVWTIQDKPIVWCVSVQHQSPRLVADAVPIQPLNYLRPAEIAVPRAISAGEIVMNVIETYGNKPWDYLNNLFPTANSYGKNGGAPFSDLADVMHYMQDQLTDQDAQSNINLYRIIRTPGSNGTQQPWYVTEFTGVRITDIRENETATTNAMQNNLEITCMYTAKIDSVFNGAGFSAATQTLNTGPALDQYQGGVGFDY